MKISAFSVSMPEYDVYETVRILKEVGYDGVEWRSAPPAPAQKPADYCFDTRYWTYNLSNIDLGKIEEYAEEVKGICGRAGLEISSIATYLGFWENENIEKALRAAVMMECKKIRILAPVYNGKENYRSLFDRSVLQVKVLEGLAKKYGVRIVFEIHMGHIIPSASAAYRLVERSDPEYIGIIYDPGNMVYEGYENYRMGLELLGNYLSHVHIKNGTWQRTGTSEDGVEIWKPVWVPYKKGMVDMKNLIGILKDMHYNGYLSIEDFSNEEDTYTKLKGNLEYIKKLIG